MPEHKERVEERDGDWLKVGLSAPAAMIDALSNFMTEIGSEGAFQESPDSPSPEGFLDPSTREMLKAFLPVDVRLDERLASLRAYIKSLAEIFPELERPTFQTEIVRDPGWGEAWKRYFKPLRASRHIVIKPTWEPFSPINGDVVIEIDPGMAFGTGQHPSTRMCLEAIEEIFLPDRRARKRRVLDVGTGTGILGIACAKLGAERVLCVDIDPKATKIARANALINQVEDRVEVLNRDVAAFTGPFHVIVANLTADILIRLRPHLLRLLGSGGDLVISGILDQNRPDVEAHFLSDALSLHRLIREKEWVCYVLRNGGRRP